MTTERNQSNPKRTRLLFEDRPQDVKDAIQNIFNSLALKERSTWSGFNGGEKRYYICATDDYKLITKIVESNPQQTEFTVLEIGAGDFTWVRSLSTFLNDTGNFSAKKFNIYGLNAEGTARVEEMNNVKLHYYGGFKSEDLILSFKEKGIELDQKVDFIISRWSLRHMVDPVGTVQQAFSLLKINGLLLVDDFYTPLFYNGASIDTEFHPAVKEYHLFSYFNANTLICPSNTGGRSFFQFILQKTGEELSIPISYTGLNYNQTIRNTCPYKIKFTFTEKPKTLVIPKACEFIDLARHYNCMGGSPELYKLLQENQLFAVPEYQDESKETYGLTLYEYCGEIITYHVTDEL
jgi:SAM-dependent methyltransferase